MPATNVMELQFAYSIKQERRGGSRWDSTDDFSDEEMIDKLL